MKKTSLLPMTFINRFEKNYGTIRGGGGKNLKLVCPQKKENKNKQTNKLFLIKKKTTTMTMGWMFA
jgi:hypothetical protein